MADNLSKLYRKFKTPGLSKSSASSGTRIGHGSAKGVNAICDDHSDASQAGGRPEKRQRGSEIEDEAHTGRTKLGTSKKSNTGEGSSDSMHTLEREDEGDAIAFTPMSESQLSRYAGATNTPQSPRGQLLSRATVPAILPTTASVKSYYTCWWRTPNTRKNKNWDGDGIVIVQDGGRRIRLVDATTHAQLGEDAKTLKTSFLPGEEARIGGKEIEIEGAVDANVMSNSGSGKGGRTVAPTTPKTIQRQGFRIPTMHSRVQTPKPTAKLDTVSVESFYAKSEPQGARCSGLINPGDGVEPRPLYDPTHAGAIVMKRPSDEHQAMFNKSQKPLVDVVVNPILASKLRPAQVEGVRFLYERVMCMRPAPEEVHRKEYHMSAILADDMGVGKTLQTIAVIEMLLKQSCYYHPNTKTIQCALVVCPLSLVSNWRNEFQKWLGATLRVQCIEDSTDLRKAASGRYHVLIIGYERLVRCINDIMSMHKIGLLVCDEAHRLKSNETKTTQTIQGLNIARRILVTGTPLQNNLGEYYTMIDITAPGLLSGPADFKKLFEDPIMRSRQPGCPSKQRKAGEELAQALKTIVAPFILRRTAKVNQKFLPSKHEMVIFCAPSPLQLKLYDVIVGGEHVAEVTSEVESSKKWSLPLISVLRKLCNSPELLIKDMKATANGERSTTHALVGQEGADLLPTEVANDVAMSGKFKLLRRMLREIRKTTNDKVVIASNFTATLDIVEGFCKGRYKYVRMDGKTKQKDRQSLVNKFNTSDASQSFIFLMSSKAGGQGINLIGANRFVLLDGDWNPAADDQAMARIHRHGQTKECYIYRLLLSGTMDEKIFIRQGSKRGLGASVLGDDGEGGHDGGGNSDSFTLDELRAIFQLHTDTTCLTHCLVQCPCKGDGIPTTAKFLEEQHDQKESPPPPGFVTATQALRDDCHRKQTDYRKRLAPLLQWAHYDVFSRPDCTAALVDVITTQIASRQKAAAANLVESAPADEHGHALFDMAMAHTGDILHIFSKSTTPNDGEGTPDSKRSPTTSDQESEEEWGNQ